MKQWSVAVLLSKRVKDGGVKLLLVPVFVHANTSRIAMDQARECAARDGYDVRGCAFVEADGDTVSGEGLTWNIGAWVVMP